MKEVKIGDICEVTSSKRIYASEYKESGIPFYRSREIIEKSNNKNISEQLYISEERFKELKNKFGAPTTGDILLTSVGTLGIPYIVKEDDEFYFKDGNLTWMKNFSNDIIPEYLYYWLSSDFGKKPLIARAIGSSQGAITIDILKKYKILMPEVNIQIKIINILKNMDYLLNNNNRRIFLLEQMAEEIYKNFFAYHKIKNNSEEKKLGKILDFQRGISYSSEEINCEDGSNLINLKNINAYGGFRRDGTKKYDGKYKESQIVKSGDLIMGVTDMTQDRRTVGSVALIPTIEGTSVISADLVKVDSKIDNTFLYAMFKYGNLSKYISQFANGANVLHLKPQSISNIKVQLPNIELINSYVKVVKPIIEEIDKLNLQNDNLTKQRDLLLPRLMSGKLEVK